MDESTEHGPPLSGQQAIRGTPTTTVASARSVRDQKQDEADKLERLVSNIGMVSVQGTSDPRFLGSTSGISFARVAFAAIRSSVPTAYPEKKSLSEPKLRGVQQPRAAMHA